MPTRALGGRPKVRAPARPYHHGSLRRALLDAALDLAVREGPEALTLRGVARAAGVSANAPYNHFDDKASLLAAVAAEGVERLHAALVDARDKAWSPASALEAIGVAYVGFAVSHDAHFRLFSTPEVGRRADHPDLAHAYERIFDMLFQTVRACQGKGLVREGDARRLALTAWSTVHGLATLLVDQQVAAAGLGELDATTLAQAIVRTLLRGLQQERR